MVLADNVLHVTGHVCVIRRSPDSHCDTKNNFSRITRTICAADACVDALRGDPCHADISITARKIHWVKLLALSCLHQLASHVLGTAYAPFVKRKRIDAEEKTV
jgi:hypothetical protein